MVTKYKGVFCASCRYFIVIGQPYQVERPEQIGVELRFDPMELPCPKCGMVCAYSTADVVHSTSLDGKEHQGRQKRSST